MGIPEAIGPLPFVPPPFPRLSCMSGQSDKGPGGAGSRTLHKSQLQNIRVTGVLGLVILIKKLVQGLYMSMCFGNYIILQPGRFPTQFVYAVLSFENAHQNMDHGISHLLTITSQNGGHQPLRSLRKPQPPGLHVCK